jgi:hypothetical protein
MLKSSTDASSKHTLGEAMGKVIGFIPSLGLRKFANFHDALFKCCNELFGYTREEFDARWRPKTEADRGTLRGYTQPTSDALFDEWKQTRDAGWLYSHPEYKWDSLGVSTFQTTATTANGIGLIHKHGFVPKAVFDWGAGPGFSTLMLAKNFPNAVVHYNELNDDLASIFKWFLELSKLTNVSIVKAPTDEYDLIQAYEIAEHIPSVVDTRIGDPITETAKILGTCAPKAQFLHSSCWSAERRYTTLGHFLSYDVDGKLCPNNRVNQPFQAALLKRGWQHVAAGWNSRPHLFTKP